MGPHRFRYSIHENNDRSLFSLDRIDIMQVKVHSRTRAFAGTHEGIIALHLS